MMNSSSRNPLYQKYTVTQSRQADPQKKSRIPSLTPRSSRSQWKAVKDLRMVSQSEVRSLLLILSPGEQECVAALWSGAEMWLSAAAGTELLPCSMFFITEMLVFLFWTWSIFVVNYSSKCHTGWCGNKVLHFNVFIIVQFHFQQNNTGLVLSSSSFLLFSA